MNTTLIKSELDRGLFRITLSHPERRNAISIEMAEAFRQALDQAASEKSARVALLTAEGPAFCAGMDLKAVALDDPEQASRFASSLAAVYRGLLTLPIPLLCGVDGPATAGGVGFALASDLLWVGPKVTLSFPETKLGIVPATVSVVARRRLNAVKLTGMLLSGRVVDPEEALRLGLADFVSSGSAAKEAEAFARKLIEENSDEAMRRTKAFLQSEFETFLGTELENAKREFCEGLVAKSAQRGIQAFREKRTVRWSEPES